jgi:putative colanic acid biosysnthesis UDP-glucose lipid carrier transferase
MAYKYSTFVKWINILFDYSLLNISLYLGVIFEKNQFIWIEVPNHYKLNFLLLNLFWFYSSTIADLYSKVLKRDANTTIKALTLALLIFLIASFSIKVFLPDFDLSKNFIVCFFIAFSFTMLLWKSSFLLFRKSRRRFWIDYKKIVIVGCGPVGVDLYNYILENPQLGYKIEGIFDDLYPQSVAEKYTILGKVEDCFNYVKANGISEVYCALSNKDSKRIKALMQEADKHMIRLRLVPDVKRAFDKNILLELYGHMPILTPRQEPLENKANEFVKRAFDIVFSSFVLVFLLSWLLPLLALIIKLDSKGPVFFKQLRSGRNNKPFYCLKFRSMYVNTDSDSKQASRGDSRITRIGAVLRKTNLDELPQFINVLFGDMSVVGPRPHMLKHTEDYSLLIDNYMVRHFLTPGITGWAQVNGYRGETKETSLMNERVKADIWYLENWSFFLDLKIVFLTVWQAIRGNENAY